MLGGHLDGSLDRAAGPRLSVVPTYFSSTVGATCLAHSWERVFIKYVLPLNFSCFVCFLLDWEFYSPEWSGENSSSTSSSSSSIASHLHTLRQTHSVFLPQGLALKHKFAQIFPLSKETSMSLSGNFNSLLLLREGPLNSLTQHRRPFLVLPPAPWTRLCSRVFLQVFSHPICSTWNILSHNLPYTCKTQCKYPIPSTTINLFRLCFPSQLLWPVL